MITITAIIRARVDAVDAMRAALSEIADYVRLHERETHGFFVCQDLDSRHIFTTYERFYNLAAMDSHNGSTASARFFATAAPLLDGLVILRKCEELIEINR